jgi:hypothetical protein
MTLPPPKPARRFCTGDAWEKWDKNGTKNALFRLAKRDSLSYAAGECGPATWFIRQIPTVYRDVSQCRFRYLLTDSLTQWRAIAAFNPPNLKSVGNGVGDVAHQGDRRLAHWLALRFVHGLNDNVVKSPINVRFRCNMIRIMTFRNNDSFIDLGFVHQIFITIRRQGLSSDSLSRSVRRRLRPGQPRLALAVAGIRLARPVKVRLLAPVAAALRSPARRSRQHSRRPGEG